MLQNISGGDQFVYNSTFLLNTAEQGGGIFVDDNSPQHLVRILNCSLYDNGADVTGGGIELARNSKALVENCTIAFNQAEFGGGVAFTGPSSANGNLLSCIVVRNSKPAIYVPSPFGPNSITYSNTQDAVFAGVGNKSLPAKFVSAANRNFNLKASSPCLDIGVPVFVAPDTFDFNGNGIRTDPVPIDLAGFDRVVAAVAGGGVPQRIDMGAFERAPDAQGQ